MKSFIRRSTTPLGAVITAFLLLVVVVISLAVGRVNAIDASTSPQNGRLLTIHDGDSKSVVITDAQTIGEALTRAGVSIDKNDAVEPSLSEELVASEYDINIYRARPVIVVDGSIKSKIITPYQSARKIASSAGITLYDGDTTTLTRSDDIISDGAGLILTINRATPFTFTLYGKTSEVRTQGHTVGDMLVEKGLSLGVSDRIVPGLDTPITAGMSIRVWREGKQTVTIDESVNFDIQQVQNGDQYVGYKEVETPGQPGSRSVTYEITIQDGQEVGRTEIASLVTKEPVKQIEIVGTKYRGAYTTPGENETITWNYLISKGFTREQTAGIMGNLMQEHRFNTTGDGLAQWTGSRKENLLALPDPYNIYTQLDFMMYELNTTKAYVQDSIRASSTVEDATIIFQNKFEACNPLYCMESQRIQYAYNIFASH